MKIKNYTGQVIKIVTGHGIIEIPKDGEPPNVNLVRELITMENSIPVMQQHVKEITGLPKPQHGVYFVVSKIVAMYSERSDLLIVDDLIREKETRKVIACNNLAFLPPN